MKRATLWEESPHGTAAPEGVVISSRIRLARNLDGMAFPEASEESARVALWKRLAPLLTEQPELAPALALDMGDLEDLDKQVLVERHLLSREQARRGPGSGLVIGRDRHIAVMVNEEDHLRIQVLSPGQNLSQAWDRANRLDSAIEALVPYAFSPRYGYLTTCPTNVGTGLRASVMLHLAGLALLEEVGPVIKGLDKLGLTVRGLWGEGTEALGNMFQISNQTTLGESEQDTIARLDNVVKEMAGHEHNARQRLLEKQRDRLHDHVQRAWGLLLHVQLLATKECLAYLSGLRLGMEMGILQGGRSEWINRLFVEVLPAHLQKRAGSNLEPLARDKLRAERVRKTLRLAWPEKK